MFLSPGLALKFDGLWLVEPQRQCHPGSTPTDIGLFNLHESQFPYLSKE